MKKNNPSHNSSYLPTYEDGTECLTRWHIKFRGWGTPRRQHTIPEEHLPWKPSNWL